MFKSGDFDIEDKERHSQLKKFEDVELQNWNLIKIHYKRKENL